MTPQPTPPEATPAQYGRRYALEDMARAAELLATQYGPEPTGDDREYRASYVSTCAHAAQQMRLRANA